MESLRILSIILILASILLIVISIVEKVVNRYSRISKMRILVIILLFIIAIINSAIITPYITFNTPIGKYDTRKKAEMYLANTYKENEYKIINIDEKGILKFEVEINKDKKIDKEIPYSVYENGGEKENLQDNTFIIPIPFRF